MSSANPIQQEKVKWYLRQHPTTPSRTLARIINKDYPAWQIENLRSAIRSFRGTMGNGHRRALKDKEFYQISIEPPASDTKEWLPYIVGPEIKSTLIVSDLHIPYHNPRAIKSAVEMAIDKKVDSIILDGDVIDAYELSSFIRDPNVRNFKGEVELLKQFFDYLEDQLPNARIIYKTANHEQRVDNYLMKFAPALFGMDGVNLSSWIGAVDRGIIMVNEKRPVKYGHLAILHGDEFSKGITSPVNPARGLYLRTHTTTLGAHHHQSSTHHESDLNGVYTACWTLGTMSELHPQYAPINRWNLGFGFAEKDNSNFSFENYKIIKNVVYPA